MPGNIQSEFDKLAALTLSPAAPPEQYQDLRRYFFAGVLWAVIELEVSTGPAGPVAAAMAAMRRECEEFGREVKAGRA